MADSKISGLAAVAAFAGAQEFAVNDAGTSKKISGTQLIAAVGQGTLSGGYAQITANQAGIVAQVDVTGLTVTVTPVAGRRLKITAFTAGAFSSVVTDLVSLFIMEGAAQLSQANVTGTTGGVGIVVMAVVTPTVAAHTYKVQASRATGTGSVTIQAAATYPSFILVEDIGV